MAYQNTFDFNGYNQIMKNANTGLKLHLSIQLLKDVVGSLEYFDNPLEAEVRPIYLSLKAFHNLYKETAKKRAATAENSSERSATIDNATIQPNQVESMLKMFAEYQRMQAAKMESNDQIAESAEKGIEELRNAA